MTVKYTATFLDGGGWEVTSDGEDRWVVSSWDGVEAELTARHELHEAFEVVKVIPEHPAMLWRGAVDAQTESETYAAQALYLRSRAIAALRAVGMDINGIRAVTGLSRARVYDMMRIAGETRENTAS